MPEILTQPNVPKPMHGLNPRTLLGQEWWDRTRFAAQKRTGYRCAACGVHKTAAKGHQWLEGHEAWNIDYKTGRCEVTRIEPLCHYCHNFIHSGRLSMIMGRDKTESEVVEILEHGFAILAEHKLKCFGGTLALAYSLKCQTYRVREYPSPSRIAAWGDFILVLDGVEYQSKFATYAQWEGFYHGWGSGKAKA